MANMETSWSIPTPDGKSIHGVRNSAGQGAKSAVFIVHGLGGNIYEYHIKRAADEFVAEHDIYRISLYDDAKNARTLPECTLETHAADLNTVLAAYAGEYEKVFVIGHSYGGATIMLANPAVTAVSLWDPTFNPKLVNERFSENYGRVANYYTMNWGIILLPGEPMVNHANTMDEDVCKKLSENFRSPMQVVVAADGFYVNNPNYDTFTPQPNRRDVVNGTVHCFYEGNSCESLLTQTQAWFRQFG